MEPRRTNKIPRLTLPAGANDRQQWQNAVLTCVNVVTKHTQLAGLPIELAFFVRELVEDVSGWNLENATPVLCIYSLDWLGKSVKKPLLPPPTAPFPLRNEANVQAGSFQW